MLSAPRAHSRRRARPSSLRRLPVTRVTHHTTRNSPASKPFKIVVMEKERHEELKEQIKKKRAVTAVPEEEEEDDPSHHQRSLLDRLSQELRWVWETEVLTKRLNSEDRAMLARQGNTPVV